MLKSKRLIAMLLTLIMLVCLVPMTAAAEVRMNLVIDGKTIVCEVPPYAEAGTTFVPLRVATEALGATVTWSNSTQTATIKTTLYEVKFTIGSKNYTVNGQTRPPLTAAPALKPIPGGTTSATMIPIRALSEALGAKVEWVRSTNTAKIDYFSTMNGSLKISGSTTVQPICEGAVSVLRSMNSGLSISVAGGGSGTGINEATNGTVNIGMSSSAVSAEQRAVLNVYVIAHDGIAIIVNNNNAVRNLTKEQAQKIFTGEIKNWKDVGGADAPILVQTRETGSGTLSALEDLLLGKGVSVIGTATPHNSTALLQQAVAAERNAIGFISSGYVDSTVRALTIGNVAPTVGNIKNGTYPICRDLVLVTRGTPGALAAMYIDFLMSDAGQKVVTDEKFMGIRA
jgi:phosphate transport system substrate-binding protein